jgi:hypothetical protein
MGDFSRVFTLEVDRRPTLAFEAHSLREAQELSKQSWLRSDLLSLKSEGARLCTLQAKFSVRTSSAEEAALFRQAAAAVEPSDEIVLAYLIELDKE